MATGILVDCSTGQQTEVELPDPPLADLKLAKWGSVKAIRDALENGPNAAAPTPFGAVDCDDTSKIKINGLVVMAQIAIANSAPFSETFTLADNSTVQLSATQMIQMGLAVGQYVSQVHARARTLREAVEAAADAGELAAIDITTGWP